MQAGNGLVSLSNQFLYSPTTDHYNQWLAVVDPELRRSTCLQLKEPTHVILYAMPLPITAYYNEMTTVTQLRLCTANKSFKFNTIVKRQGLHWSPSSGDRVWYILYYIIDQGIFQLA